MTHESIHTADLRIHFEDTHLIVLEKPTGLLSQGEHSGDENLVDLLRKRFGRAYVGLVHRLDRNTSGLMVVAKRSKSAKRLTQSLQDGLLVRQYLAWVHGTLHGSGQWQHELIKDERLNIVKAVPSTTSNSKNAVLAFQVIGYGTWHNHPLTLLELILETGRSHQIRAQAAAEGAPLLGDLKYLRGLGSNVIKDSCEFGRPALHSNRLEFPHPMSCELHRYESPLPSDMASIPITSKVG